MDNIENEEPIESGEIILNDDVGIQDQEGEKTNEENGEDDSKESEKREGTQEKMQSEKRSESQKKESKKSQNSKKSRVIELDNREEVDRESGKSKGKETAKYEDQDEKQLEFVNDEIPIVENKTNMSLEGKMKDNHSFGIMPENNIQSKKNDNQITAQDSAIQQVLNLNETKNYLVDKKNDNPFFEDESPKKNKQKSSLEPSDNPRKRIQSAFPQSNVQESGRLGKLKIERDRKKLNDPPEGETILVNHDQHNDSGKQAAPSKSGHIDLFLRKNKLTRAPIDHDQIKMHAITTKASMIEAELAREEKRKKFLEEWNENRVAIQRTQESNGGRGYQRSFIEQQEKSEHQRRVLDTLREKRHNMIKYGEFVKHYAKDSNKSMEYKAKPTTSAFQLIERERKRSMEMVKRNREMGNNFMKEGNKIARVQLSMSPVLRKRKEPEEEVDPYEVRKKEARAKYSNLHDIFKRDKQIEGYHLDHGGDFGRIANVKKIDNFTSHASQSMAIDMIKQIDMDLLRKERESTVQNRELLDNEFMKSIQAKIDVLNNRIPQKNLKKSPELRQSADPKKNRDVVLERIKSANKTNKQKLKERPMKLESLEAVQKKKNEQNPLVKIGKKEDDVLKKKEEDKKAKMIGKLAKLPNRSQEEKKQIQNQEKTDPKVEETNFILEEKGSEQTGKKDGKTLVPKDDPYIKGLSRDLDQDPSESMSASHQNKLKKDLGDFFDKNHEDDGKDNEF